MPVGVWFVSTVTLQGSVLVAFVGSGICVDEKHSIAGPHDSGMNKDKDQREFVYQAVLTIWNHATLLQCQ